MSSNGNQARTGTFLPNFQNFDPQQPYRRLWSLCERFKIAPETVRGVITEPVLRMGEVVSFRGEAALMAYACGKHPDAISRMAAAVVARGGPTESDKAAEARTELWKILRDFSMGYGPPVEEQLGLITKGALIERFNLSAVNTLTSGRLFKDLAHTIDDHPSSFGNISSAYLDIWVHELEAEHFKVIFSLFIQGKIEMGQGDGSLLSINPTHSRYLLTQNLSREVPYIFSTAVISGAHSVADVLPQSENLGIRADVMLWRKEDTVIIADITGSF